MTIRPLIMNHLQLISSKFLRKLIYPNNFLSFVPRMDFRSKILNQKKKFSPKSIVWSF